MGETRDTGPHALSTLSTALGPIESTIAVPGAGDLVHLAVRRVRARIVELLVDAERQLTAGRTH